MEALETGVVATRLNTPIPKRMRVLPRDSRGYPIPYTIMRDRKGKAHFTINDHERVLEVIRRKHCAICNRRFDDGMWFVSGSRSFLHENGAFLDPPLHVECAEYALTVCPFLASPSYAKPIEARTLQPGELREGIALVRPAFSTPNMPECFGLGRTRAYRVIDRYPAQAALLVDHWDYLEFWRNGQPCDAPSSGSG